MSDQLVINEETLDLLCSLLSVNDDKLNTLLKVRQTSKSSSFDVHIVERLTDLYNPSTSNDVDVELIKNKLFK